jgi:4'-phosphopantetheinyl transferase
MILSTSVAAPRILRLRSDAEVHIWQVELDRLALHSERTLALSAEEQRRAERLYFERDRQRFVGRRVALRMILAEYLDVRPNQVQIVVGADGKPVVVTDRADIRFSCSHSSGSALVAISFGTDVGVDVERSRALPELDEMARLNYSEDEWLELQRMTGSARQHDFFRLWTAKEAVLKATGDGLRRQLDSVLLCGAHGPDSQVARIDGDASRRWLVAWFSPESGYVACVAMQAPITPDCQRV